MVGGVMKVLAWGEREQMEKLPKMCSVQKIIKSQLGSGLCEYGLMHVCVCLIERVHCA